MEIPITSPAAGSPSFEKLKLRELFELDKADLDSHAFKIVRLEGYEDTLNNLPLRCTPEQEAALTLSTIPTTRSI